MPELQKMHSSFLITLLILRVAAKSATPTRIDPVEWHLAVHHLDGQCGHTQTGTPTILQSRQPECPPPINKVVAEDLNPPDWAPWTHAPYCVANSSYCVFTNAAFQRGRGFSIVAAPQALASMQRQLEFAFAAPARSAGLHRVETRPSGAAAALNRSSSSTTHNRPDDQNPPSAWEVNKIPGKGLGMVAKRRIPRGETFLVDYAAILASVEFPGRVKHAQGIELLDRAAGQLPDPERVLGLARSSTRGAPVVEDVMRTNTFSLKIDGETYMGLFPTISRINHACGPNSQVKFDPATLSQKASAFHDIEAGEEITISYAEFGMTYQNRQSTLLNRWGFKCTCALCSTHPSAVAASDARRTRAISVRDGILTAVQTGKLRDAIELGKQLVEISSKEGLVSGLGDHYEVLARLHMGLGDLEGAGGYARRALEEMRVFGGSEEYGSFDELDLFVKNLERRTRRV
ncbi:hypothetical protein PspLS_05899 [Pyricularia sp. CBS 133598]|nr:hypothetical protein PspLS_05899 [Pyricularia sp. CBS 133598]